MSLSVVKVHREQEREGVKEREREREHVYQETRLKIEDPRDYDLIGLHF